MTDKSKLSWLRSIAPDWNDVLIYSGAAANTALWIRAGEMVETGNPWTMASNIALGVVMSFGPVEIIRRWAALQPTLSRTTKTGEKTRPNPRYYLALGSFSAILATEAALLGPVVLALLADKSLYAVLGGMGEGAAFSPWAGAWSAGRVLVSAVALAGLSVTGGTIRAEKPAATDKPAKSAELPAEPTAKPAQSADEWRNKPYVCEPCRVGYDTQRQYAGHMGGKAHKPAIVGYAVEMKPITKEQAAK